jgi:uncharacterized membrane protein YciS (DUF1049 family)
MSFKVIFRSILVLIILFVMLYVGMHNTQNIDFYFPVALQHKLTASAGLIYFGMFAVGFLAGTILTAGGGKKSSGSSSSRDR